MTMFMASGPIWSVIFWVVLLISAAYFLTFYFVYRRQTKRWEQSNIPFLEPTFLIGHRYFLSATKYSAMVSIDRIYKENSGKDLIGFFLGAMPLIMLRDQKLVRQVYVKHFSQAFATGLAMPDSEVEAQYMINLTANEDRWKFGRTVFMPLFALNWFQGPRFERIKETIHDLWHKAEKSDGSPIIVKEVAKDAILNIASSAFGIESKSKEMKDGLQAVSDGFFEPSYRKLMLFNNVSLLPSSFQKFGPFKVVSRKSCDIVSEIIQRGIKQRDETNTETGDFIDILRALRGQQESKNGHNKAAELLPISSGITSRQMTGLGLALIVAGSKTVHELLGFAIHALSLYPEYQSKIRREVREALKEHGVSELNFEVVQSLSFTFQCIFEASRLYPGAAFIMRQCSEDFQIPGTNYIFRKGDRVVVPLYSSSRDEMLFRDPDLFYPERFDSKDTHLAIPPTLMSFGTGPRKCPGYKHGLVMIAAILASLLYKYEIKPRSHLKLMDATDFDPKGFITSPRKDVLVDLVRYGNLD